MAPFLGQTKTLFMEAHAKTAVLLTKVDNGYTETVKRFRDTHAALDWCIRSGTAFMLLPRNPERN